MTVTELGTKEMFLLLISLEMGVSTVWMTVTSVWTVYLLSLMLAIIDTFLAHWNFDYQSETTRPPPWIFHTIKHQLQTELSEVIVLNKTCNFYTTVLRFPTI